MYEYIRLEEEKARKHMKVFNWETPKYGKIWYDEDVLDLRSVETEFPAIIFNDNLTLNETLFCEPTYTNADIADFETRLARIYRREVHRVYVFNFWGLSNLIAKGLSTRMLMEHRDAQGQSVLTSQAWRRLFDIRGPLVHELILKFFKEMQAAGFDLYWAESTRQILNKGDLSAYWIRISSVGIVERSQAPKKVTVTDGAMISGGQIVSRLANNFGLLTKERLQGLTLIVRDLLVIDMAELEGDVGGVAEEAPVAPRGGDEDEEMPQVMPPSPRTQGERIARL
nr:hypothetical protein [Tanacetum cinerariifolium]